MPDELDRERETARRLFRSDRISEPMETYTGFFHAAYAVLVEIMTLSADLTDLQGPAQELLGDQERQNLCRYLAAPPLSEDDLKTLADSSLTPSVLSRRPEVLAAVMDYIRAGLDRHRFPWVGQGRRPTPAELETALIATAAMYAMRRTETWRRGLGRSLEQKVLDFLATRGLVEVPPAVISNASHGPRVGEFCGEATVAGGKADVVVRLFDGRLLPIECKVSNSETNSYKRLIHDCGEKAQAWVSTLGPANCLPVAVLSGVYSLRNLQKAQGMGLVLVWSHAMEPLGDLIDATR